MHRYSRIAIFGGLLLALSQPAMCAVFTGPNTGLSTSLYNWAYGHNWNLTGLSLVDTPDGMKISGSISANITDAEPLGYVSGVSMSVYRPLASGTNLNLTLLAQQTGTVSSTGGINVTGITTSVSIPYALCSAFASQDTGGNNEIGLSGSIAAGPTESSCQTTLIEGTNPLFILQTSINYAHHGPGTITIDFGNSILGEVRDTGVPEPSTLWLLSAIIPVALYKLRHQPISRIRS